MTDPVAPYSAQPTPAQDPTVAPHRTATPYPTVAPYSLTPQQYVPGRRRRTWDLVLSCILLPIGAVGALLGIVGGATIESVMGVALSDVGGGLEVPELAGALGVLIIISHIVLYLVAVAVTIPLLITRRISFWVPLAAGVLAAIIYNGSTFILGLQAGLESVPY